MKSKKRKIIVILIIILLMILLATASYFIFFKKNEIVNCSSYSIDECPSKCVICPPCEVCSSISCQTEEFCANMGFDREWYSKYVTK